MHTTYLTSASEPKNLPFLGKPEVAFIGRSNCGKSTLLNALAQHKGLARASRVPGRTQLIHFFGYGPELVLADLPGYGFSQISRKRRSAWAPLLEAYFQRPEICRFFFLMDVRRDWNEEDWQIAQHLGRLQQVTLVLTKCDKLNQSQAAKRRAQIEKDCARYTVFPWSIHTVSSLKSKGIEKLRLDMLEALKPQPEEEQLDDQATSHEGAGDT